MNSLLGNPRRNDKDLDGSGYPVNAYLREWMSPVFRVPPGSDSCQLPNRTNETKWFWHLIFKNPNLIGVAYGPYVGVFKSPRTGGCWILSATVCSSSLFSSSVIHAAGECPKKRNPGDDQHQTQTRFDFQRQTSNLKYICTDWLSTPVSLTVDETPPPVGKG